MATDYNTGNPTGSADPRDLHDNAVDIDEWATSQSKTTHDDRLGFPRRTWHGMEVEFDAAQAGRESEFEASQDDKEQRFQQFLADSGYQVIEQEYAAGIEITERNQVILADGEYWRVSASTVLPYTTTGAGMPEGGNFVAVGDALLRQELVAGTATVSSGNARTQPIEEAFNDRLSGVSVLNFDFNYVTLDLTLPLRAAINYCVANGFKRVIIPDRYQYNISIPSFDGDAVFVVPAGITVSGDGFPYMKVVDASTDRATVYSIFRCEGVDSWVENIDLDVNHGNQLSTSLSIGFGATSNARKFGWRNLNIRRGYINLQTNLGTTQNRNCTIRDVSLEDSFGRGIRVRYTDDVTLVLKDSTFDLLPTEVSASYFECSNSHRVVCTAGTVTHARRTEGVGFRVVNGSSDVTILGGHSEKGLYNIFCTDSRNVTFVGTTGNDAAQGMRMGQSNPGYEGADNILVSGVILTNIHERGLDASISNEFTDGSLTGMLVNSTFHCLSTATVGIQAGGGGNGDLAVRELNNTIIMDNPATPARLGRFEPIDRIKAQSFFSDMRQIGTDAAEYFEIDYPLVISGMIEIVAAGQGIAAAYSFRIRGGDVVTPVWKTPAGTTFLEETTGALTGTTGTDNRITVSAGADGIWIENRLSATVQFSVTFSSLAGNFVQ